MVKIVVLASFNMDLVMRAARQPAPGETLQGEFAMYLGGKGFNQAVAARRLGAEVSVIGRLGDDEFGRRFLESLDREGIDRRCVSVDPVAGTGVASIIVDDSGENAIVQAPQANRNVRPEDIAGSESAFAGTKAALLQLETSEAAAIAFSRAARDAGATTLLNPAPAAPVADELIALADVLLPNEVEAATLAAAKCAATPDDFAAALYKRSQRTIVVTLGERGALAIDARGITRYPAFGASAIDTVGAGDAFCAAFAVATAEGAGLADAVRFANAAGALATTRRGAEPSMPQRDEVEKLMARGVTL